jgi:phosphatidylserine synthase
LFLLQELGLNIQAGKFWPVVLLIPGLAFWSMFLSRRQHKGTEGVLIPGTILTLLGAYFMIESLTNYATVAQTSFIYTLIVGLAFFAAYYFGDRSRGYLIPAWILLGVSALIMLSANARRETWPIILIIVGVWLIVRPSRRKPCCDDKHEPSLLVN